MADQKRVEELEKLLREAELRAESLETRLLEEQQPTDREQQRAVTLDAKLLEEQQRAEREQSRPAYLDTIYRYQVCYLDISIL